MSDQRPILDPSVVLGWTCAAISIVAMVIVIITAFG